MRGLILGLSVLLCCEFAIAVPAPTHPDPDKTPGELCTRRNTDFLEYRYQEEIPTCERNVSNQTKSHIYDMYGIPQNERRYYTVDHFIPLSIGGNNEMENLWPEHRKIKKLRPNLEMETYEDLNSGKITQRQAIRRIVEAKMNPPQPF